MNPSTNVLLLPIDEKGNVLLTYVATDFRKLNAITPTLKNDPNQAVVDWSEKWLKKSAERDSIRQVACVELERHRGDMFEPDGNWMFLVFTIKMRYRSRLRRDLVRCKIQSVPFELLPQNYLYWLRPVLNGKRISTTIVERPGSTLITQFNFFNKVRIQKSPSLRA